MKNLANCKPSEFVKQTSKIRKAANKWLIDTGVLKIRAQQPDIPDDATEEEIQKAQEEQARKNATEMLDAILDQYPDETLDLLALLCFVEPENVDDHEVTEYLDSFNELISNKSVMGFFISLMRLANLST